MARLNLDVLREICSILTAVRDVLSFSRACSDLRPMAVERRLSMQPIIIDRGQSLRNLYNFVFVNKGRRGPHIRAIAISEGIPREGLSEDLVDHFLALLSCATRLRKLTLFVPVQPSPLFTAHPSVLPAVAGLTSLQELEVTASTDVATVLLGSTCSALKVFRHQRPYEYVGNEPSGSLFINMAPELASTLEEIEVPPDFVAIASRSHASFPAVRSLILADAECDEVFHLQMDVLLALFPNLDCTLIIDIDHDFDVGDNGRLVALRGANREAQERRAWKALDRVACPRPDVLYGLGLACPIRRLTLRLEIMDADDDPEFQASASNVRAVLQECTPTHFALIHDELSDGFWSLYSSLFPANVVARLTHIVLEMGYTSVLRPNLRRPRFRGDELEGEAERSWEAILDSLVSGLKSLRRLTHVRIIMSAGIVYYCEPRFSDLICDGLRSFKFDRLLAALPGVLPTLSYVFITSSGSIRKVATGMDVDGVAMVERWKTSRAWRVRRRPRNDTQPKAEAEGGMMHDLEELAAEEAEAMIDWEELLPTERSYWGVEDDTDVESGDSVTLR